MSLVKQRETEFVVINETLIPDGYGANKSTYTEGIHFFGAMVQTNANQVRAGNQQAEIAVYSLITPRNVRLDYHDKIKRLADGRTFRLTSHNGNEYTPETAGLDMRVCTAEDWRMPDEQGTNT